MEVVEVMVMAAAVMVVAVEKEEGGGGVEVQVVADEAKAAGEEAVVVDVAEAVAEETVDVELEETVDVELERQSAAVRKERLVRTCQMVCSVRAEGRRALRRSQSVHRGALPPEDCSMPGSRVALEKDGPVAPPTECRSAIMLLGL